MKIKRILFMQVESRFGHLSNLADMLRYDMAFQSTVDPEYIAFPVFQTKDGNLGGNITTARWHSFSVDLRFLPPAALELLSKAARTKPEAWITYRHARNEHGQFDYGKLVPFSLADYCTAKDTDSL